MAVAQVLAFSTGAVQAAELTFTSHVGGQIVQRGGFTLFGVIADPEIDQVQISIENTYTGNIRQKVVDVGEESGIFAVRVFKEDTLGDANSVELIITAIPASSASATMGVPAEIRLHAELVSPEITRAIDRLTFGVTEDLQVELTTKGFDTWLTEQLNPEELVPDPEIANVLVDWPIADQGSCAAVENSIFRQQILYAASTRRQLREVVGQFWSNHFHTAFKSIVCEKQSEIEFYRTNAFANFGELLQFMAKSPHMLHYLDNRASRVGAINENFAREILELHTVGVNGGYTYEDILAVARVFTGWRIVLLNPDYQSTGERRRYGFRFEASWHDSSDKFIPFLETTIAGRTGASGVEEGEQLLQILANHPKTIEFICLKLVKKFIADSSTRTQACKESWLVSSGDMREVLRSIFESPDFVAKEWDFAKAKTPFEFVVSAIRGLELAPPFGASSGTKLNFAAEFMSVIQRAGWDNTKFPAPTGLPDSATVWTGSGPLIGLQGGMSRLVEKDVFIGLLRVVDRLRDQGLETAEATAAYLVRFGLNDRVRPDEFFALVQSLKGADGEFSVYERDTVAREAIRRAVAVMLVTPSALIK